MPVATPRARSPRSPLIIAVRHAHPGRHGQRTQELATTSDVRSSPMDTDRLSLRGGQRTCASAQLCTCSSNIFRFLYSTRMSSSTARTSSAVECSPRSIPLDAAVSVRTAVDEEVSNAVLLDDTPLSVTVPSSLATIRARPQTTAIRPVASSLRARRVRRSAWLTTRAGPSTTWLCAELMNVQQVAKNNEHPPTSAAQRTALSHPRRASAPPNTRRTGHHNHPLPPTSHSPLTATSRPHPLADVERRLRSGWERDMRARR